MDFKLELEKIKWNEKFVKSINSIAQSEEARAFLVKKAQYLVNQTIPQLQYNTGKRYYSGKRLKDSINISKVKNYNIRYKGDRYKSAQITVNFKPRKTYFYYAMAGRRRGKNGQIIYYQFSNGAIAFPLESTYKKNIRPTFSQEFRDLFNQILEKKH